MNTLVVVAGAVAAVIAVLAVWVWALGRIEAGQDARGRDAMRQAGPPVLGGAPHAATTTADLTTRAGSARRSVVERVGGGTTGDVAGGAGVTSGSLILGSCT